MTPGSALDPDRLLSASPRRRVTRIEAPGEPARVRKEFIARTPLRRLREALKALAGRTASQREARALRALAPAGAAVPRLVSESSTGLGTRILELGFVEGVPLVRLLGDLDTRRVVLARIGVELRRAHAAGWIHGDLHEENVLVDGVDPVLIDWQRARPRGAVEPARIADAARFEHSMWLHGVPLGDRLRFRRSVLGLEAGPIAPEDRARLRAVGEAVRRRARQFAMTRTRRVMRAEDGRVRIGGRRAGGLHGLRLASILDAEIRSALDAHVKLDRACSGEVKEPIGRYVERGDDVVLKRDHRAVLTAVGVGQRSFVVKEVRKAGWRRRLADALRGSPARRGFRAGHGLLLRGIPTATPFAWIERRRFGLPVASWLILEDLRGLWPVAEPPRSTPAAVGRHWPPDRRACDRREALRPSSASVADALGVLLLRLHRADVSHGDLQALHVLLRERSGGAASVDPVLIDCDAVRFEAGLGDAERIEDLAALNASIPDALLSASERRRVLERVTAGLRFDAPRDAVAAAVVRRSLARRGQWRGEDCASVERAASPAAE
jgi:tRNA A-37 threonylcarbamoyl transferase component Bud32